MNGSEKTTCTFSDIYQTSATKHTGHIISNGQAISAKKRPRALTPTTWEELLEATETQCDYWIWRHQHQAAAEGGYLKVVEVLLKAGADVNARPARHDGRTAIQAAAEGGYLKVIEVLLKAGANVNADPAEYEGRTAVQAAANRGYLKRVKVLPKAGANANADPGKHAETAIQAASHRGDLEMAEVLIEAEARARAQGATCPMRPLYI